MEQIDVVVWEWLDKKCWVAYDITANQLIEEAYLAGKESMKLDHGFFSSGPYTIDFNNKKQVNDRTNYEREIRRNFFIATKDLAEWVCLVKKKWERYDPDTAKLLEGGFLKGESKVILSEGFYKENGPYEVDFVEMHQMNVKTGFVREVRRIVPMKAQLKISMNTEGTRKNSTALSRIVRTVPKISPDKLIPCHGNILIFLKGARDLADIGPLGLDPYVVITTDFNPFVSKTEWKFKTINPTWNQQFTLPVSRFDAQGNVFFTVYNYNHLKKNKYLGRLDVPLFDIVQRGELQGMMKLTYEARKKNKKQADGHLDVRIQWVPKPIPQTSVLELGVILKDSKEDMKKGDTPNQWTPSKEIVEFTDPNIVEGKLGKYVLGEVIGEGGFAVVKIATNSKTNEKVAIKIIQKLIQADADSIALITREIQVLHMVDHSSCVSFVESRETSDNIYIIMEYVGGGDLLDAILDAGGFDEPTAAKAIHDILKGLQYLHSQGICHRDMKPENVLFHPDLKVWKIADFGCATQFPLDNPFMTEYEGTIQYMAPEVLVGDKYTATVDIWATGVITYVSLSACFPWEGKTDAEVQESIMNYKIKFYSPEFDDVSPDATGFILRLLEMNVSKRISVKEALEHPWMKAHKLV